MGIVRLGSPHFPSQGKVTLSIKIPPSLTNEAGPAVMASVGAYQLERHGVHLFERVEADHFTILGLPLLPALDFLRQEGSLAG